MPISRTSYDEVLRLIEDPPADRARSFYFCTVHGVMSARRDPALAAAMRGADVTTPDGMPLVWTLRRTVEPGQGRVYGPDLMEYALAHGVERGWRHYFYGATPETLRLLTQRASEIAPGVQIVGSHAPPFRPLTDEEEGQILDDIRAARPDCVWVGLGMPKQELWVDHVRDRLPGTSLLAVGAAFDLLAGTVPQAPDWVQERGLEWLYRLAREPRRLWRRYLFNNPTFAVLATRQVLRHRS